MKKEVGKRKMAFTRDTIRELSSPASVTGGAGATTGPVSSKPCSDGTCYKFTTVCQ